MIACSAAFALSCGFTLTLKSVAAKAQERACYGDFGGEFLNPDLREALMNVAANRDGSLNTAKLSGWLQRNTGKIVGGLKVIQDGRDNHAQKALWKVVETKGIF